MTRQTTLPLIVRLIKKNNPKINALVIKLIKEDKGIWIGVTATPGRLDLNNTLRNNSMKWVRLNPHSEYYGHDQFFPHDLRKIKMQSNIHSPI